MTPASALASHASSSSSTPRSSGGCVAVCAQLSSRSVQRTPVPHQLQVHECVTRRGQGAGCWKIGGDAKAAVLGWVPPARYPLPRASCCVCCPPACAPVQPSRRGYVAARVCWPCLVAAHRQAQRHPQAIHTAAHCRDLFGHARALAVTLPVCSTGQAIAWPSLGTRLAFARPWLHVLAE